MKNQYVLNGLTVTGTVLLLLSMGGTARAIPVSSVSHHTITSGSVAGLASSHSLNAATLFGASIEDRIGSANFSSSGLPQVHHLSHPPKTSPASGSTTSKPLVAGVPDGGKTAMMLGGALSGMMLARRKIRFGTT